MANAPIVRAGDGEIVRDIPRRTIEILAASDELTVTWSRYAAGEEGPVPHVHHEHTDCFYVLDGELRFRVGPELEEVVVEPGTFVAVPPEITHSFDNVTDGETRFLNFHAPDGGFAAYMRGQADGFDSENVDPGFGLPSGGIVISRPGDGRPLAAGGSELVLKLTTDDVGGVLAVTDATVAAGFPGPPPHRHHAMIDCFYVLDGTVTFTVEGARTEATAGDIAFVEPGTVHTFANATDAPARFLNLYAPAGFEQYLLELSDVIASGAELTPALMGSIASRYDFEPV